MMTTRAEVDQWFAQPHDESRETYEGNIAAYDFIIAELEEALLLSPNSEAWQINLALDQFHWIRDLSQIALDKMNGRTM